MPVTSAVTTAKPGQCHDTTWYVVSVTIPHKRRYRVKVVLASGSMSVYSIHHTNASPFESPMSAATHATIAKAACAAIRAARS